MFSIDSRTIKRGESFIAIKGKRFDGHDFIDEAIKKGASGIILDKNIKLCLRKIAVIKVKDTLKALGDIAANHRRRFDIPVVGITGSNGKTTVKEMLWSILKKRYTVLKNRGTENNLVGLPLTLLRLKEGHRAAVLEMGTNRWGEIARLTEILRPTIGVITNIGPSHLESFKDEEGVLRAKSELVHKLKMKDSIVLNGDDPMLSRIKSRRKKVTFGLKKDNDFRATEIKSNGSISFTLNGLYPFKLKILGNHNIYNALAAIAVSSLLGIEISLIKDALLNFKLPYMRMAPSVLKGITVINDAYNSNPFSLKWAIDTFSNFKTKGRRIIVSGDMLELGERRRLFHSQAGRLIAGSSIDALIAVGELSRHTAQAALRAGMGRDNLWSCSDSNEAARILKSVAKRGDAVLVKGSRAMCMERIINSL